MTNLLRPDRSAGPPVAAVPTVGEAPTPVRRRRPLLLVVSGLLFVLAAVILLTVLQRANAQTLVWTVAVDVARGEAVTRGQLQAVAVPEAAAPSLLPTSDHSVDSLTTGVWAADLRAGQLLSDSLVIERLPVASGRALVGVQLEPGSLPAGGVRVGDVVLVVDTDPNFEATTLVERVTVEAVALPTDEFTSTVVVSLDVPAELAPAVAKAGAAGRIALVVVP